MLFFIVTCSSDCNLKLINSIGDLIGIFGVNTWDLKHLLWKKDIIGS